MNNKNNQNTINLHLNDTSIKLFSGLMSGVVNTCIFHPMDTLRARYITRRGFPKKIGDLTKGIGFSMILSGLATTAIFGGQDLIKSKFVESG